MRNAVYSIGLIAIMLAGCQSHPYQEMEERELASGVRYDTLLMGMTFGMSLQDFFDRCMDLNRQKLIYQGPGARIVEYVIKENVKSPVTVQFQPSFHEDGLYEMSYDYFYNAWAPWNTEFGADSLILTVKSLTEDTFGDGFLAIEHPEKPTAYAKVDGNRRISISLKDERRVSVRFTDLTVAKQLNQ